MVQVLKSLVGIWSLAAPLVFLLTACNDSGFSGSNAPKKSQDVLEANPDDFVNDSDANGKPDIGPNSSTDTDTDFDDFFDGLNDNDVGDFDPDVSIEDNSVTFGVNEVFHLGDGSFDGSSCKFTVETFGLAGKKYFFEFEVNDDDTVISIRINRICGVDYPDTNFARLYGNGREIEAIQIPAGSVMLSFNTTRLNAGRHRIEVEAKTGSQMDNSLNKGDADDFIIGNLNIRGSKHISRGEFGVN